MVIHQAVQDRAQRGPQVGAETRSPPRLVDLEEARAGRGVLGRARRPGQPGAVVAEAGVQMWDRFPVRRQDARTSALVLMGATSRGYYARHYIPLQGIG